MKSKEEIFNEVGMLVGVVGILVGVYFLTHPRSPKEPLPTKAELKAVSDKADQIGKDLSDVKNNLTLYKETIANKDKTIAEQKEANSKLLDKLYKKDLALYIIDYYQKEGDRRFSKVVESCIKSAFEKKHMDLWETTEFNDSDKPLVILSKIRKECDYRTNSTTKEPCANEKCPHKGEYGKGKNCPYCNTPYTYSYGATQINSACKKELRRQLKKKLGYDGDDIFNLDFNIAAGYLHITERAYAGHYFNNFDSDFLWELKQIKKKYGK